MNVSFEDLLLAYRQAKASLYFERRGVGMLEIAKYEEKLASNLQELRRQLKTGRGWFDGINPGRVVVVPKRVGPQSSGSDLDITYIGDKRINNESYTLDVQLRLCPSPEFSIIEVLYLWRFGSLLESIVPPESNGYRLDLRKGEIRRESRWLFEYWPPKYNEFRTKWLRRAKFELRRSSEPICVLSTDLAGFYDTIDAQFLLNGYLVSEFFAKDESENISAIEENYLLATKSLVNAYNAYNESLQKLTGISCGIGIPIGALTSRVVANAALASLDDRILSHPDVICYRRYVDDIILVGRVDKLKDDSVLGAINHFIGPCEKRGENWNLDTEKLNRTGSRFRIQKDKCRIYLLQGESGLDFLDSVGSDFAHLVSEQRIFLDPEILNEDAAKNIIKAGKDIGGKVRSLRDADRLKVEHLALSISLGYLERISKMVEPEEAIRLIRSTLGGLERHIIDGGTWVELLDSALRLLKLSSRVGDWNAVTIIMRRSDKLWESLLEVDQPIFELKYRDETVHNKRVRSNLVHYLQRLRLEAICSSMRTVGEEETSLIIFQKGVRFQRKRIRLPGLLRRAKALASADLRSLDREDDFFVMPHTSLLDIDLGKSRLTSSFRSRLQAITLFERRIDKLQDRSWKVGPLRLFLSTRPPSYFDIARRWLYNIEGRGFRAEVFDELLSIVNAIRGTNYHDPVGRVSDSIKNCVTIRTSEKEYFGAKNPKLVLANLATSLEEYNSSIEGDPIVGVKRLKRIATIIEKAQSAFARPANGLLVLPELSLPRKWLREIANHIVKEAGFGLVTGLEYLHEKDTAIVYNQVVAVLPGAFGAVASWPWTKRNPADEEAEALEKLGYRFRPSNSAEVRRTVVDSPYGRFSVLICSELLESSRVNDLLGRAEIVLVPSWNRDTASYDHLIQSVGFQLHAIIAIANNGDYSDCRAWAPKQERWQRDLCRLIERSEDSIVTIELPIASLRKHHKSPDRFIAKEKPSIKAAEWRPCPPDWIEGGK